MNLRKSDAYLLHWYVANGPSVYKRGSSATVGRLLSRGLVSDDGGLVAVTDSGRAWVREHWNLIVQWRHEDEERKRLNSERRCP